MTIPIISAKFNSRSERTKFVYDRFSKYFDEGVLDVGCFEAPLREMLNGGAYTGIDIVGRPDIKHDLNKDANLPFQNSQFKTVISIETLEHIDYLHQLFSECVRVSRQFLIVSLPNCWRDARRPIERGVGEFAHYGLPVDPPLDRHRWFFNFSEASDFYLGMATLHGLEIVELFGTEQPRNVITQGIRRLIYAGEAYRNRYVQTVWVVFRKTDS